MKKRIRLFCDPLTVLMASIWVFIVPPSYAFVMILATYNGNGIHTLLDKILVTILWSLILVLIFLDIKYIPQWFSSIELDGEGIRLNSVYKKSDKIPYAYLNGFQLAYYHHLYKKRVFLVISRAGLSPWKLAHINNESNSTELIKIKLTKSSYKCLCEILPIGYRKKLDEAMEGDLSTFAFDVDKFLERQEKVEKKKRRKRKYKKK